MAISRWLVVQYDAVLHNQNHTLSDSIRLPRSGADSVHPSGFHSSDNRLGMARSQEIHSPIEIRLGTIVIAWNNKHISIDKNDNSSSSTWYTSSCILTSDNPWGNSHNRNLHWNTMGLWDCEEDWSGILSTPFTSNNTSPPSIPCFPFKKIMERCSCSRPTSCILLGWFHVNTPGDSGMQDCQTNERSSQTSVRALERFVSSRCYMWIFGWVSCPLSRYSP